MTKLLLAFLFIGFISCSPKEAVPENEILWDTWGIPHIYAQKNADLYRMMGWAQMRNHGDLLLKLYGEARAKSSEYWGEEPTRDVLLHQLGLIDAAKKSFATIPSEDKEVIESFAEGINAYADKYLDSLDERYQVVLPVKPEDILLHSMRVMYFEFLINPKLRTAYQWSPGSNAWALNGKKTASGRAMLLANPHLPWSDFWLFFEAHLIKKTNSLYGATLVGLPTLGIGFNENLGWTHTVNTLDNVDLYELSIDGDQYLLDGEYKDFEVDSVSLLVKADTTITEQVVVKKRSAFGMVLKESGNKAIAINWPNMDGEMNALGQWRAMGEVSNLKEFKEVLDRNELPLFNVVYADRESNILYQFGGNIPKKKGDWEKWQAILPTSSSEELWDGYYETSELPNFTNPESGWIQNANDPPFTSTIPPVLDPSQFASHIAPNHMIFRPQRSAKLMMEAQSLTLDELVELKHDTKAELALRLQDELESLKEKTQDSLTIAALNVLTRWDGAFDASSKGAILFLSLVQQIGTSGFFEKPWSFDDPVNTPDGLLEEERILQAIKKAAGTQLKQLGKLDVLFGDVFRLKVGEYEFSGNGGPGNVGLFRTLYYVPGSDGKWYPYHGDSYVCATEFGEEVKSKALLSYGNATQPGNPHVGDQLALFERKQLREVWFTRSEQEANLERVEKQSDM